MKEGDRFETNNYGWLKVVEYRGWDDVDVVFEETGFKAVTYAHCIRNSQVKDKLAPSVWGVGYIGVGDWKPLVDGRSTQAYRVYRDMLRRCYSDKHREKYPTYKDCTVCKEWHNFQTFAEWFGGNYIEGYHMDKDIKIKGNKVYSPTTCTFVTHRDNNIEAHAKGYKLLSPEGVAIDIYNMKEFCRDKGLNSNYMSNVHSGRAKQHKGWTKYEETDERGEDL